MIDDEPALLAEFRASLCSGLILGREDQRAAPHNGKDCLKILGSIFLGVLILGFIALLSGCSDRGLGPPFFSCLSPPNLYFQSVALELTYENPFIKKQDRDDFQRSVNERLAKYFIEVLDPAPEPLLTSMFLVEIAGDKGVKGIWATMTFSPGVFIIPKNVLFPKGAHAVAFGTYPVGSNDWKVLGTQVAEFIIEWWQGFRLKSSIDYGRGTLAASIHQLCTD